ncbi:ComF family protein [Nonomuraea rubra]|uniref:ComF family protein n=1 Tax=Nonomuraea rubra TaxID=46180 RepID=UPI0033E30E6E
MAESDPAALDAPDPEPPPYLTGPPPAGFGQCPRCPYGTTGPFLRCYDCASETIRTPAADNCPVCHLALDSPDAACWNRLCRSPTRKFDGTYVIGVKAGELEKTIWQLKYGTWDGRWGWGVIHARIVLGYLYTHPDVLDGVAAIIPTPGLWTTHRGAPRRDYVGWVIEKAIEQDDQGLPFVLDPPLIEKTGETKRMRETAGMWERDAVGHQLKAALHVPDPSRLRGRTIMVYDDVFTTGTTLNAIAGKLKSAGAAKVYGLTLARQPRR